MYNRYTFLIVRVRGSHYQLSKPLKAVRSKRGDSKMSKKGETGEQDRGKPQPRKKKDREDARKKKKLDRVERQKSRLA